ALVLYHNRYAEARGSIRVSAAYAEKRSDGARPLRQRSLIEGLGFARAGEDALLRCRDQVSGQEFLFRAGELREHGLRVELDGYQSRVFLDWHEVARDSRPWDELERALRGGGVANLEDSLWGLAVTPARAAVVEALRGPLAGAEAPLGARLRRALGRLLAGTHRRLSA